ncbi:MAG: hypothetical protein KC503_10945, partial [Myxococcales bacterium]|nr:hypothetical protein [Myxococcales bacterium]
EHLRRCAGRAGFVAALEPDAALRDNYARVWARDGVICGLAALLSGDGELAAAFERTLETLAAAQGRAGQAPSNVAFDAAGAISRVSYGGKAGRVDATTWWIIGAGVFRRLAPDRDAAERRVRAWYPRLARAAALLEAWQLNERGLIYVPLAGNWADEYPLAGYLLYDQVLALWALRELSACARAAGEHAAAAELGERAVERAALIDRNMWPRTEDPALYDDVLRGAAPASARQHYLAGFDPARCFERFDALGNAIALLLGLADDARARRVCDHARALLDHDLVPAFAPVITREDPDWPLLEGLAAGSLRNAPGHYHNGGLWPMVGGFWALAAARCGDDELSRTLLRGVTAANAERFPEYLAAGSGEAAGMCGQAWSAAAELLAQAAGSGWQALVEQA